MVDINLLNDSKEQKPESRPVPPTPEVQYSSPDRERMTDPTAAAPSGLGVWLKKLIKPTPAGPTPVPFEKLAAMKPEEIGRITTPEVSTGPTDMFAELDQPSQALPKASAINPPARPRSARGTKLAAPRQPETQRPPVVGSGGFSVDLLSEALGESQSVKPAQFRSLGIAAGTSLIVLAAAYGILMLVQVNLAHRTTTVEGDINQVEAQINDLRPIQQSALSFANRLSVYQSALYSHIYWSSFFDKLQQYTLPAVVLNGAFRGTTGGTMTFSGTSASLDEVAHQLAVYQNAKDFLTTAKLDSVGSAVSTTEDGVERFTFSITGDLVSSLFFVTPTPPSAPSTGGTQ